MRKIAIAVVTLVLLSAGGSDALAQSCDDGPDGPYTIGSDFWFDYTEAQGCYSTYGNVSEVETCFDPGWEFGTGAQQWATVSFTVTDAGDYFSADSFVYFNDPHNSSSNGLILDAFVDHPGTSNDDYYPLAVHDGTDGDLNCDMLFGNFYASPGDVVTISITVGKANAGTTIEATVPRIFTIDTP